MKACHLPIETDSKNIASVFDIKIQTGWDFLLLFVGFGSLLRCSWILENGKSERRRRRRRREEKKNQVIASFLFWLG